MRIFKKYNSHKGFVDKPRAGRPRKITVRFDRCIKNKSIADSEKNAVEIAREIQDEHSVNLSSKPVGRRLKAVKLNAYF